MTQKAGSFLCTLLSGRSALWVPEEPQAGRGAGVWEATWPVPSAQDEETGFGFQVCHQVQCDLVQRTMDFPSPSRVLPPLKKQRGDTWQFSHSALGGLGNLTETPEKVKVGTSGGELRATGGSQSTFHNDNDSFKK